MLFRSGLGALGVVTEITLDLLPTYSMQQNVYLNLSMEALEANFEEIVSAAYSVSLFTRWQNNTVDQVWLKSRVAQEPPLSLPNTFFGATASPRPIHPIATVPADSCTEQMGVPGAWQDRLPHFRMEFTPSHGEE